MIWTTNLYLNDLILEPLRDNLMGMTYDIFEKDLTKYGQYKEAFIKTFRSFVPGKKLKAMLVGAGRGPLARMAFLAAMDLKADIFLYIVEKNPNTVSVLHYFLQEEALRDYAKTRHQVVISDIRDVDPEIKVDVIFSELLGSFGDNELSPECLEPAQRHLNPGGVMIPRKSTSILELYQAILKAISDFLK